MTYLAHISADCERTQSLKEHEVNTAALAEKFASVIGEASLAKAAALLHDMGKSQQLWQNYLKWSSGYDKEIPRDAVKKGTHSTAGAIWLIDKALDGGQFSKVECFLLSYIILGHHAGLPDFSSPESSNEDSKSSLFGRVFVNEDDKLKLKSHILKDINLEETETPEEIPCSEKLKSLPDEHKHLWVRMLFSCLVDADYLDTEKFMDESVTARRSERETLASLKERFDSFMKEKSLAAAKTPVNEIRAKILEQCRAAAKGTPGFYSLTVPTGGGKTLSAMAFALEHALKNGKRRVIVAIPYTSIIEQTAKTYKYGTDDDEKIAALKDRSEFLFGEKNVLEHHSKIDPEKELYMNFLASQNWDAPIVVTTNVRLFESLLAAKSSSCRKLHNIAESVIILDEAQKIPRRYLKVIISVLKGLVEHFGVTVLFCSATQPALRGKIGPDVNKIEGIENCVEIIKNIEEAERSLKRVKYEIFKGDLAARSSWEEIAEELKKVPQVLCVVNKRRDCRELTKYMPEGTIQLSGLMCGEEISEIISDVKKRLRDGKPVRVISTQLIESGVDIDFPEVWRALAQLDSIVQTAGRANREGLLMDEQGNKKDGRVVIFNPESEPFGEIKIGAEETTDLANGAAEQFFNSLDKESFERYFKKFYARRNTLDQCDFERRLVKEANKNRFYFRSFDNDFKIIDSAGQKNVFVRYGNGDKLANELQNGFPDRKLMARLQRFSVNIPEKLFSEIDMKGGIEHVGNYYVLSKCFYEPGKGVLTEEDLYSYDENDFIY